MFLENDALVILGLVREEVSSEETLFAHKPVTEWARRVECGPCHIVYKALLKNECNVERSLCGFSPRKPYNYALFGTFNSILENTEKDGEKRGSRILKRVGTVLFNVCEDCILMPVEIQK